MTKILTLTDALEALDELEASAIGDEPYNHFGAEIVRRYIEQEFSLKINKEQAEQEPEYKGWYCAHCERGVDGSEVTFHEQHEVCGRVITDDVPPKPVKQEPLVRFCPGCGSIGEVDSKYRDCCPDGTKARLVPSRFAEECQGLFNLAIGNVAPVQEPVAWRWPTHNGYAYAETHFDDEGGEPLYAAPVRTKDLTPYEITALIRDGAAGGGWQGFAQRVIAADRKLNGVEK